MRNRRLDTTGRNAIANTIVLGVVIVGIVIVFTSIYAYLYTPQSECDRAMQQLTTGEATFTELLIVGEVC